MLSQKSNAGCIITGEIILVNVVARQMKEYIDVTVHTDFAMAIQSEQPDF